MIEKQVISNEARQEIEGLFHHLPHKQAACIEALKVVQKHNRWVSDEALKELAPILGMGVSEIDSVATFYNIIFRKPVARHVIFVCNSVSCWIMGYEEIIGYLRAELNLEYGQSTPDNRFTLLPIPCLGTCDHAPSLMVDTDLYRDVTTDKLNEILLKYE